MPKIQKSSGVLVDGGVEDDDGAVLVDPAEGGAAAPVAQDDEVTILIGGAEVGAAGAGDEDGLIEGGEVTGGEDGEQTVFSPQL